MVCRGLAAHLALPEMAGPGCRTLVQPMPLPVTPLGVTVSVNL